MVPQTFTLLFVEMVGKWNRISVSGTPPASEAEHRTRTTLFGALANLTALAD